MTVKQAVQRSMPNPTRPRLTTQSEAKFADVEQRSAACYAEAEDATEKMWRLARTLSGEENATDTQDDGIPIETNFEDTSSVHHLEDLRQRVKTGEHEAIKK